jgi:hypothetical protein
MLPMVSLRRALALTALMVTATLAACAEPPAPPAPPPAPPPPVISLSPKVIDQASAYRRYVQAASAISPAFKHGGEVAEGVRAGASFEPQQLLRGAISYGAIVALQDPAFVAGVRTYANDATQRREVAYQIMRDPAYVVGLQGSASAAGLVMNALAEDGGRILNQGKAVKQAAYDVQRSAWSKAHVAGQSERLALAKQLSATPILADMGETSRLQQAAVGAMPLGVPTRTAAPPYTRVTIQAMAVAALAALGYADDASLEQVMPMLTDLNAASCLNMSKLNLYQCLAVSKPHYEDVFCLGQHVLMDVGKCVLKSVGAPEPAFPPTQLTAAAPPTPQPVSTTR